ncbi:MAG: hypothetical protein HY519_03155, partial [Candidatus Aenigmarchaeota archaeon]|nr:hypothetical protein [Candidatus Aenigmarchaeota archaeon]
ALSLHLQPTTWFTYEATNKSLDTGYVDDGKGGKATIRQKYVVDPLFLNDNLANATGASVVLISVPDAKLVYVQRSGQLSQYPLLYGVAAAGFMDQVKDVDARGNPNPFHTMARKTQAEMGITAKPEDFILRGVGRAMDDLHGEIWGELRTDLSVKQILATEKSDKYEQLAIKGVYFDPAYVAKIFKDCMSASDWKQRIGLWLDADEYVSIPAWVPAHFVATVESLIQEYGRDKVERAFRKELG